LSSIGKAVWPCHHRCKRRSDLFSRQYSIGLVSAGNCAGILVELCVPYYLSSDRPVRCSGWHCQPEGSIILRRSPAVGGTQGNGCKLGSLDCLSLNSISDRLVHPGRAGG